MFRSLSHIYVQVIDDSAGVTLASASTVDRDVRDQIVGLKKSEQARVVGKVVAERALSKGIVKVVFDRGGYKYHGRVRLWLRRRARLASISRRYGLNGRSAARKPHNLTERPRWLRPAGGCMEDRRERPRTRRVEGREGRTGRARD